MSVQVPEEVEKVIEEFKTVDWPAVARRAISKKAQQLAFLKHFASESELTEQEALELGSKVSKAVSKKYEEMK